MTAKHIDEGAFSLVQLLARFWTFKRRPLAEALTRYLQNAQNQLLELSGANETLSAQYAEEQRKSNLLSQANKKERDKASALQSQINECIATIGTLKERLAEREASLETVYAASAELEAKCSTERQEALEAYSRLEAKCSADLHAAEDAYDELDARRVAELRKAKEDVTLEQQARREVEERFGLIRSLLSAVPPRIDELSALEKVILEDYMDFTDRESALAGEVQAARALRNMLEELSVLIGTPRLANKTKIAIAGGFSAGKSAFINSLIGPGGIKLSEGINPVTSVPSYVISSEHLSIRGYSINGGFVEIDPRIYDKFGHEYFKQFGFDLRHVMPFVSVEMPMRLGHYENICFVDTPGYDAGQYGMMLGVDRDVAKKLLNEAHAVIWVIDTQKGTIDSDSLDLITRITKPDGETPLPIYVVLNKADKKSDSEVEDVMFEVATKLEDADIYSRGICAYSSLSTAAEHVRFQEGDMSLAEFLSSMNRPANVIDDYHARIGDIFTRYRRSLGYDKNLIENRKKALIGFKYYLLGQEGSEFMKRHEKELYKLSDEILGLNDHQIKHDRSSVDGLDALVRECNVLEQKIKERVAQLIEAAFSQR